MNQLLNVLALFAAACVHAPPLEATSHITPSGEVQVVTGKQFLQYGVATHINAPPERVWALLVDAPAYPSWNSTVLSIEGSITDGESIALVARVDPERTFHLDVSEVVPARSMIWSDGNKAFSGTRTFTLAERSDGTTEFAMKEALAGWMLPMIEGKLPDFGPDFEQFARDLRQASETLIASQP